MANVTYKTVIKTAIDGFNGIQEALSELTDLGITNVSKTNNIVKGSITPNEMRLAIGKVATIPQSGGSFVTGHVDTYDGTFEGEAKSSSSS